MLESNPLTTIWTDASCSRTAVLVDIELAQLNCHVSWHAKGFIHVLYDQCEVFMSVLWSLYLRSYGFMGMAIQIDTNLLERFYTDSHKPKPAEHLA